MGTERGDGVPQLADRLNALFKRVPQPDGQQLYTNERAAQELTNAGAKVTGTHLSLLRSGKRDNPSARLLAAIADLFDVPIAYFFDDAEARRIDGELELMVGLRDADVRGILTRAAGLSESSRASLGSVLNRILEMEKQRDDDPR